MAIPSRHVLGRTLFTVIWALWFVACGDAAAPSDPGDAAGDAVAIDTAVAADTERRGDAGTLAPPCIDDATALVAAIEDAAPDITLCDGADLRVAATVRAPLAMRADGAATLRGADAPAITVLGEGALTLSGIDLVAPDALVLPALEVQAGGAAWLTGLTLDAADGIGLRATEATEIRLTDVAIVQQPNRLAAAGALFADCDDITLERVEVATRGPFGIGLVRSTVAAQQVSVTGATAVGVAIEGGAIDAQGVTIREIRTSTDALAFGIVVVDASATLENVAIADVDGAGMLARRSAIDGTGIAIARSHREAVVLETSDATLNGLAVMGARRAGVRLAAESALVVDGGWIGEVAPSSVDASDGDGIVLDDDTTGSTITVRNTTVYAPARVGVFLAGEGDATGPRVVVEDRVTICTDEARRSDWSCEGLLACARTALDAGAAWRCTETEAGTQCTGAEFGDEPAEPAVARGAVASCGIEAVQLDSLTAEALGRAAADVAWFDGASGVFAGSILDRNAWACTAGACLRDHGDDGIGAALDPPTGGTAPGWTCAQDAEARSCRLSAVPFVDRGAQLSPDTVTLSPSFDAANAALEAASVRPTFVPSSATDLFDYLEELGELVPKGIIGENGPVGRPVPDRCDDGTLRADCECGCIPGGCLAKRRFFEDLDGDGFGRDDVTLEACTTPPRFVSRGGDCSDTDVFSNPVTAEVWDARDNNCDGNTDDIGLLELTLYRTELSEFDWVHTYATTPPAGSTPAGGSLSLFPANVCEVPGLSPYDQCEPAPALGVNTEGYAVFIGAGTLTALAECRGVLGVKNVALYLLETSGEFQGYFGRDELDCTRLGYVYTGSLADGLGIGTPVYRLASGFTDPGKGDNVWVADLLNLPDDTYQYQGQPPFYAPAAE